MKASREKPEKPFLPITIIIETKEEADAMWACLNTPVIHVEKYTLNGREINGEVKGAMFWKFNSVDGVRD